MIELARHIEVLLLDNDCVIVPNLGGFITHYQPAHYEEEEKLYLPPLRTIGFNPQLNMNDGQLIQSYMQVHHTDYTDAQRRIEEKVDILKDELYQNGSVNISGIGTLNYTIYGTYEFHPNHNGILSPALYGLDSFQMAPLSCETIDGIRHPSIGQSPEKKTSKRLDMQWMNNAVAVAVAVILFFVLSAPVENTYIENGNYASLGTDCLFESIRSQSMATTLPSCNEKPSEQILKTTIAPKEVRVEKVAPAIKDEPKTEHSVNDIQKTVETKKEIKPTTVQPASKPSQKDIQSRKKYHIIVASLPTSTDADRMLKKYQNEGYAEASIITGNGRYRIALCSFASKAAASEKMSELKKTDTFADSWILTK